MVTLTHTPSHTPAHPHTPPHILTHPHTHPHTHSHTLTHPHTPSHTHIHTHARTRAHLTPRAPLHPAHPYKHPCAPCTPLQVVALIEASGLVLGVSTNLLGLTLVAWGNSAGPPRPVPGTHCPVSGTHCPVPGAHCPVPGTHCPVPGTHCPVLGAMPRHAQCHVLGALITCHVHTKCIPCTRHAHAMLMPCTCRLTRRPHRQHHCRQGRRGRADAGRQDGPRRVLWQPPLTNLGCSPGPSRLLHPHALQAAAPCVQAALSMDQPAAPCTRPTPRAPRPQPPYTRLRPCAHRLAAPHEPHRHRRCPRCAHGR